MACGDPTAFDNACIDAVASNRHPCEPILRSTRGPNPASRPDSLLWPTESELPTRGPLATPCQGLPWTCGGHTATVADITLRWVGGPISRRDLACRDEARMPSW